MRAFDVNIDNIVKNVNFVLLVKNLNESSTDIVTSLLTFVIEKVHN